MLRRVLGYLDENLGVSELLKSWGESPLPGGARWARTFGAASLLMFGVMALTGVALAAWYAPSSTDAWASVHFIQYKVTLGWLLRGVHHLGGNVLIVLAIIHVAQAVYFGLYRAPRALTWVTLLLAMQVLLLVSHTGYLLPQDLRAYWATQVLVGIAGNQPMVGPMATQLIQGGPQVGNATLTHLYALHVLVTPGLLILMLVIHFRLLRRHGAAIPATMTAADAAEKAQTYFPFQLSRDLIIGLVAVGGTFLWAWKDHGVELGGPGDPAVEYVARPEWYFLPIFALRHWFTGSKEFIATAGLPGIAIGVLTALPWIHDLLEKRSPRARPVVLAGFVVFGVVTVLLGMQIVLEDIADVKGQETNAKAEVLAKQAHRLAMSGVPITGPLDLYKNDPVIWGTRVWNRDCAACHTACNEEPFKGSPCLEGYASRTWLKKFLKAPSDKHFFGNTKIDSMEAFDGDDQKAAAIVEFLYAESNRPDVNTVLAEQGKTLYGEEGCESCHTLDGKGMGDAPDLKGWASPQWLADFIRTPGDPRFYGKVNEMDAFPHEKMSTEELKAVVAYLRAQTDAQAKYP